MKKVLSVVFFLFIANVFAQSISIQLGKNSIALNEYFTISISVANGKISSYSGFPDIAGFNKQGTSSSSSMNIVNGSMSSSFTLTQNYQASKEGTFKLSDFEIIVDNKKYTAKGTTITVGPPAQRKQRRSFWDSDPFEDMRPQNQEFVEIEDDAFFAISTNKNEIFEGEGVTLTGALYIPMEQKGLFNFPKNINEQIHDLKKKITPTNCWEEEFEIKEVSGEAIELNGIDYLKLKLFQSTFYPLNDDDIQLKSYKLHMIKYKIAKQRSFFGSNAQETSKAFASKAKTIKVKPLPPHPLRDQVCVGDYKMVEKVDKLKLTTNEGLKLNIKVYGEGNISSITTPSISVDDSLLFFKPNTLLNINRNDGVVVGSKEFVYDIIPNEPGMYHLSKKISFIYFNYRTAKYDTLSPTIPLLITGESRKNNSISDADLGAFYDTIDLEDNKLRKRATEGGTKLFVNFFILAMLVVSAFVIIKKNNG